MLFPKIFHGPTQILVTGIFSFFAHKKIFFKIELYDRRVWNICHCGFFQAIAPLCRKSYRVKIITDHANLLWFENIVIKTCLNLSILIGDHFLPLSFGAQFGFNWRSKKLIILFYTKINSQTKLQIRPSNSINRVMKVINKMTGYFSL